MFYPRHLPRLLLSLLVLLTLAARSEAQGIPLPADTPRAGSYATPAANARSSKPAWRPKGSIVPAQAEIPETGESTPEPTLAPSVEVQSRGADPAAELQPLRAPANVVESATEEDIAAEEPQLAYIRPNPVRTNPLRPVGPTQIARRQPPQRIKNPVGTEYDPEAVPRPEPPRILQDIPGPQGRPLPHEPWQVSPGRRYAQDQGVTRYGPAETQEWPADINNPTEVLPDQYPDGQIPGEELYGLPRVFETNAYGRFTGRGEPLTAGSWLNRPYYVGGFIGGISGDTLVAGEINQNGGFFWGGNVGWDYDPYWGLEMRLAFSTEGLDYLTNPFIDNQFNDLILWDTSFIYYPWGDARWRPYFKLGFGFADFDYTDAIGIRRSEMVYEMPFGIGMKYRVNQYWTWRFDATDNLIFGGNAGLETQNQFSLAAGLEFRFGGRRQSYWPWNPSRRWR